VAFGAAACGRLNSGCQVPQAIVGAEWVPLRALDNRLKDTAVAMDCTRVRRTERRERSLREQGESAGALRWLGWALSETTCCGGWREPARMCLEHVNLGTGIDRSEAHHSSANSEQALHTIPLDVAAGAILCAAGLSFARVGREERRPRGDWD
jgi:hypothetical protein